MEPGKRRPARGAAHFRGADVPAFHLATALADSIFVAKRCTCFAGVARLRKFGGGATGALADRRVRLDGCPRLCCSRACSALGGAPLGGVVELGRERRS